MNRINSFFNTDFCPWANKYVYWMKQPLGWFALAAAASLITGLFVSPKGWLMLACCLVVIAMQLAWPWVQMKMCSCEVSFDRNRAEEWSENIVRVKVTNHGPFPLWGLAIEQGFFLPDQNENDQQQIAVTLSRVPAFSSSTYHWNFVPRRRGVYPLCQPKISTAFPFGIWTAYKEVVVKGELLIWPKTGQLYGLPNVEATGIAALGAMQDRPGDQGDILGSRLWQPGESLRMVNWAQTSRTEEDLIVLERQSCARPRIQIVVDLSPHPKSEVRQTVADWQIRLAATLVQFFHGHHFDLKFVYGMTVKTVGPSRAALHACFDDLARLDTNLAEVQTAPREGNSNIDSVWISSYDSWHRQPRADRRCVPILLALADEESRLTNQTKSGVPAPMENHSGSGIVLHLDDPQKSVFDQLTIRWRALQRAQHAV